ncbi:MAG TPA: NAD(P)H-binding protein [Roseiflexaceae bacterium]|nr:NAD(P)H-binding protein [Roseiflexaceae bacterium]
MTVLLIGGTGLLGGAVAEQLAARGEPVRALVRSGKRVARLRELGFELEVGDLRDRRALGRALRDVRAVVTTAQGDPLSRKKPMQQIDGEATQLLIATARQLHVQHFVFVSALKADAGAASVPQLAYKYAAEQALQASGMGYTIIRPSSFQETFGDGFAPFKRIIEHTRIGITLGSGRGRHSFVAIGDAARAVVLALDRPEARDAIVPIGGPEDLSYREAYARIAHVTGRRINVVGIPRPLLWLGGVIAAPLLPELRGFFAFFSFFDRAGYTCVTPEWLLQALGQRRTFDEAVREMYLGTSVDEGRTTVK